MPRTLDLDALAGVLPHRGVNLIPDRVELADDGQSAVSVTRIPERDARGRELLARMGEGGACWYEPFIGEVLALTGIPLIDARLKAAGQTAVFSMVSRVAVPASAPLRGELIAETRVARDRGGFTVFATRAHCGGATVLEAEVMNGAATMAQIGQAPIRPLAGREGVPVERTLFTWKDPRLVFVDRCVAVDAAARRGRYVATYPEDHPFVPGHFPGMPVMMGMTQWAAMADAAWALRAALGIAGGIAVEGTIARPDGTQILDVRELVLVPDGPGCRIASTKRLAFREPVRPGDGLVIDLAVIG